MARRALWKVFIVADYQRCHNEEGADLEGAEKGGWLTTRDWGSHGFVLTVKHQRTVLCCFAKYTDRNGL